jgi:hypothetical protein
MRFRLLSLALAIGGVVSIHQSAEAKTVSMGVLSRSAVKTACDHAGGHAFGIYDENAVYGCANDRAVVNCTPDSFCVGLVSDMVPVTGNSLRVILGGERSGAAKMVQPVNASVSPRIN